MKNPLALALLFTLILIAPAAMAETLPPLFFHDDEIETIDEKVQDLPPTKITRAKHLLHLDSILYISKQHWTVWLQGQKITPKTHQTTHRIFNVTANDLSITAKLQSGHTTTKTLAPHQSLNLLTGEVVEGR